MLRLARERRGLTLEKVARETKIPQRHLEALEHDNLTALPDGFYRRAEIRAYARAVGLDQSLALAQLESAANQAAAHETTRQAAGAQSSTLLPRHTLIALGIVVLAAAVFGRALFERTQVVSQSAVPQSAESRGAIDSSRPAQRADDASPDTREPAGAGTVDNTSHLAATDSSGTPASADSSSELVVTTQPAGARVTVNGVGWGVSPVTIRFLPPGEKRIRVSKEGYASVERVVQFGEGQPRALDIQLDSAP
jgi:cytoskeletal protein RodZ